ncbi:MAG: chromosome segregation protein SMC [Polyangiaceae bacterium]|nr:chromosome segregation protein SMC [Polyangiaceae bacterium]
MHIKKLEIAGFKSFVDRTVIHFDHDVVGIVGPNGCGKSNIVDAFRWCMGEQSAKHLRGKSMDDVIFNGSESRAAHGLAEVTMTFENSDPEYRKELPIEYRDYEEIAITRRLFRDGTSEYLINRAQVRLRDITELFLGTGVGTKAYSIVEQGRIGQIVSARASDRRVFIEEAAGITKYKQRKKQAERKMDQTRQNLLRVTDIVAEIERTRSSLKRQAAKAERFVRYREELEDLFLHDASHRLLEFTVVERVERTALTVASESSVDQRTTLESEDSSLRAARDEAAKIEEKAETASTEAFDADNRVSTLQSEFERARDRLSHLKERERTGKQEEEEIALRLESLLKEAKELDDRITELHADETARGEDTAREDALLASLRKEEGDAGRSVGDLRGNLASTTTAVAKVGAQLDAVIQRLTEARTRKDSLASDRQDVESEVQATEAKISALKRTVEELAEGKRLSDVEFEELKAELSTLRPKVTETEKEVDTAKNELGFKRNRLRVLEDLHRRLEGVGNGARALLSGDEATVNGMVADRLDVPEELTAALAGLLGDRLQCVIVSDPERGLELLDELRTGNRGRATIAPQRPRYTAGASRPEVDDDPMVLGLLADRIGHASDDEALVRTLVGDTIIVRSASDAMKAVHRYNVTAVALDGTVVHEDGFVSGGSGDDAASAMVEQKREMRHLTVEVAELDEKLKEVNERYNTQRARMTEVGTSLDQARQGVHESEMAHVTTTKDLANAQNNADRLQRRMGSLDNEGGQLDERIEQSTNSEKQFRETLDTDKVRLAEFEVQLRKALENLHEHREKTAAQAAMVTERKVRLAQVREQVEAARSARQRVASSTKDLDWRSERLNKELLENAANYGETAALMVVNQEQRADANVKARESHGALADVRELLEQIRGAVATQDTALTALRADLQAVEEEVRTRQMELQRIEMERDHLLEGVRERFRGLDLRRVVGDYHLRAAPDAEHRRRIDELTKLIDRMGPVNLDAAAEFQEAETRYTELTSQRDDIEEALTELERAIKQMNRESRKRFKETFEAVNELFKASFQKLFKGGHGELKLSDPENLLETGIDIIAQPPGKKLANIELMSGGEKALTATALIFAIFQYKPSPFCILDEVDAPLDEANVKRYNEAIRSMTDRSQFILITHIRQTMQSVDVLYGVTMGEPGVSRLVSVKVNDEAEPRKQRRLPAREAEFPAGTSAAVEELSDAAADDGQQVVA